MADKPYILLVDDDPNIRRLVQLYLEKEGFRVVCADRGDDALNIFRKEPPDLMLLSESQMLPVPMLPLCFHPPRHGVPARLPHHQVVY